MQILKLIFGFFALLGAADRIFGSRFKIGSEFEKGIMATAPLALSMVGMISIAPVIADILAPVFLPLCNALNIDPSFVGGFVANDMGGASIAKELALSSKWGGYNGLVVASMLGATVCFTVPVALRTIDKQYHKDVLGGILCGVATLPVGCIASGMIMGLPFVGLIVNLLPMLVISVITCVGLIVNADLCRKIFGAVGSLVLIFITVGLGAGVFEHITNITIIPGMLPVAEGFSVVCDIAIILSGVFPLIFVISKLFAKPFSLVGRLVGINDTAVLGIVSSLANSIPTFDMVPKMNSKGIMMNMAFAVSASFVFGDHLAFTMAFDESYLVGMVSGKLIGGISAIIVAHFMYKLRSENISDSK